VKTLSAVLVSLNKPLELWDLDLPVLKPGQVLVRLSYSGVCHSQLLEVRGKRGPDKFLPHTLGHEGSGVVEQVGNGVTKVKSGDRVVLTWIKGAGAEVPSTSYGNPKGVVNSGAISTFMTHAVVSENRVILIADGMPLREAALLGCAIPTGAGIVFNTAKVEAGKSIVVWGAGGIGLSAILAAKARAANPIISVDIHDSKLGQAKRVGATHAINSRNADPLKTILELTGGKGADYSIEAAGVRESMQAAFKCVRDAGGLCVLAGNLAAGEEISVNPFDFIRGKRLVGTWGGETVPDRDIPKYAELYLKKDFDLAQLPLTSYPLNDVNQALDDLEGGKVGRALLEIGALSN
jgi:S-(hydroxymethyl)glutathione dehydrogenase / alcohol dehydrogenase